MEGQVLSVSDFVAVFNQTIEYAYPTITLEGELSNFRVSKNRWVYFDLKDEYASIKCFGTVYQLPGPLEDGLMMQVSASPRLHPLYNFSLNIQHMQPVGAGSLRRAAALLEAKLAAEGIFDIERKRPLPYPPARVGLITSGESAAYHDFVKILAERWGGVEVLLADVQVQGDAAAGQIVRALDYLNSQRDVDVIVITRGGGSADDLAAFSTENVTRAVAASRALTLVAIGHEVDISLAELAADQRASTPSNAAQLLVPDRTQELQRIAGLRSQLGQLLSGRVVDGQSTLRSARDQLNVRVDELVRRKNEHLRLRSQLLTALSPLRTLDRGYAIVSLAGKSVKSAAQLKAGDAVSIRFKDGITDASITSNQTD